MKKKVLAVLLSLVFVLAAVPYAAAAPDSLAEATTETDAPTEIPTESPTEPLTDAPSDAVTEAATEPPTELPTQTPTEALSKASEKALTGATEAPEAPAVKNFPVITGVAPSQNGVTVSWSAYNGAAKYIVYAKKGSGSLSKLATVTTLSYEHQLTPNNTAYTYFVRAADKNGKAIGDLDDVGYTFACLPAPKLTSIENTVSGQKLGWSAAGKKCIYRVYYKKSGKWWKLADTDKNTYTNTKVSSGVQYTYTVRCLNTQKTYPLSLYDAKGIAATFFAAPKLTKFVALSNGISLRWSASKGAYRYRVFLKTNGKWKTIANTDQTIYAHQNLKTNTTYTYAIRCINKKGNYSGGYYTAGFSFKLLGSQKITSAEYRDDRYNLQWTAMKGAARYRVFRIEQGAQWKPIGYSKTNAFSDTTAKKTGIYCYAARAIDADGDYMTAFTDSGRYYRMGVCIIGMSDSKTPGTTPRYTCPVTENELRQQVALIANGWIGAEDGDPVHRDILLYYNTHYPVAVDYKMSVYDAWCAAFTSACWIRAGIADFTGTECGCGRFIDVAKENEIWVESDKYVPKVGDAILYNWDDSGAGECTTGADHVGVVTSVKGNNFVVTEGNTGYGCCATHDRVVNQRYIRGYIAPNYALIAQYLTLKARFS